MEQLLTCRDYVMMACVSGCPNGILNDGLRLCDYGITNEAILRVHYTTLDADQIYQSGPQLALEKKREEQKK
ncbi:hypothetical protein PF005_g16211 [Phytophthora fragariae]|uniref:Ubiquitin-like domain-containing protein n=1 Tax=Phytophthora fragariae TaxID=53985 RepID=A0A6A3RPA8_9STRA|nr:hypothetical protein PF003_g9261 [Phytophthora fragariae]KAE8933856.1 hypothetical protein PF009_g16145 [Phytophthora fragariae]KAE9101154.1 hypothetical protein PF007_g15246 [Phytophthora fragariae]KAE9132195.1 hypothetical protein PF006_g15342 [Phytophthora fragariae]KAE9198259.1 hypothetical protein PF005_g16211 [Phytophthora fragariae]